MRTTLPQMCYPFPWEIKPFSSSWANRPSISHAVQGLGNNDYSSASIWFPWHVCREDSIKIPLLKPKQLTSHGISYMPQRVKWRHLGIWEILTETNVGAPAVVKIQYTEATVLSLVCLGGSKVRITAELNFLFDTG